jgi:hypothetical protein
LFALVGLLDCHAKFLIKLKQICDEAKNDKTKNIVFEGFELTMPTTFDI